MSAQAKRDEALCLYGNLLDAEKNEQGGVYIADGTIQKILKPRESPPDKTAEVRDYSGQYITPSFIDMFGWVGGDPQQLRAEQAESALGGYTKILCLPHKDLPLSKAEHVLWLKQQSDQVDLLPVASLLDTTGSSLFMNKLNKLHLAGAVAFSQGRDNPDNNRILLNCYEYLHSIGGLLMVWPRDRYLSQGFVTTGSAAWKTGLPAAPLLAETLAVKRHLMLISAAGVRAHLSGLSCAESLALVADAPVSRDVSLAHLCFGEEHLFGYDNIYYTAPPLRSEAMRLQLCEDLIKADAVSSMHYTLVEDDLQMPMLSARAGLALRSIALPLLLQQVSDESLQLEDISRLLSRRPAQILGLSSGLLRAGEPADITVFDTQANWRPAQYETIAANTPRRKQKLKGAVSLTMKRGRITHSI